MQQTTFKLKDLKPNDDNLRESVGNVSGLADSIREEGLLQPLLIQGDGTIIAGHRRYAALTQVFDGEADIPVMISDRNGEFATTAMLIENLQREGLSPVEEAKGYQRLLDMGLNQKTIAGKVGVSAAHVSKRLGLLKLPPLAIKALDSDKITVEQAYELVKLAGAPTETWKQAIDSPNSIPVLVTRYQRSEALAELEEAVRDAGGIPVRAYSDLPKQRGMVAVVNDDDLPLTVDGIKDLAPVADPETGEIEPFYVMVSVNSATEGVGRIVDYIDKELAPEKPKHVDPHADARREESEHRKEQLRRIVAEAPKRTEVVRMLTDWFLSADSHSNATVQHAAKLLDLAAVRVVDPYDAEKTMPDWKATLTKHAEVSAQKATEVLFALLLSEASNTAFRFLPTGSQALLTEVGYEPHPNEVKSPEPF
jgi:ParB/RepB/Spo0J family partition protein